MGCLLKIAWLLPGASAALWSHRAKRDRAAPVVEDVAPEATQAEVLELFANYPSAANLSAEADLLRPNPDAGLCAAGTPYRGVCCDAACGVCGGRGCGRAGNFTDDLAPEKCCRSTLLRLRVRCATPADVACVLPSKADRGRDEPAEDAFDPTLDDDATLYSGDAANASRAPYVLVSTQRTGACERTVSGERDLSRPVGAHWVMLELGNRKCVGARAGKGCKRIRSRSFSTRFG